jgi:hypothetical protein
MSHELLDPRVFSQEELTIVLISAAGTSIALLSWIGYLLLRDRRSRDQKRKAVRGKQRRPTKSRRRK